MSSLGDGERSPNGSFQLFISSLANAICGLALKHLVLSTNIDQLKKLTCKPCCVITQGFHSTDGSNVPA